jgi:hypothetical protein
MGERDEWIIFVKLYIFIVLTLEEYQKREKPDTGIQENIYL